jgi:hypothetical protein
MGATEGFGRDSNLAMGRKRILIALAVILVAALGLAWYDGGREPQRLMIEPVDLPEGFS